LVFQGRVGEARSFSNLFIYWLFLYRVVVIKVDAEILTLGMVQGRGFGRIDGRREL
jgi:hypothetical protein